MPLSDEEERVFAEIERRFVADAPRGRRRSDATEPRSVDLEARIREWLRALPASRQGSVVGPVLGAIGSLLVCGFGVAVHPLVVVVGFAVLVVTLLLLARILGSDQGHGVATFIGRPRRDRDAGRLD